MGLHLDLDEPMERVIHDTDKDPRSCNWRPWDGTTVVMTDAQEAMFWALYALEEE
jgi:hypothetical protein